MVAFSVVPPDRGQRTAAGTGFDADIAKCALADLMRLHPLKTCYCGSIQPDDSTANVDLQRCS